MKFTAIDPPRVFEVGFGPKIQMKDCGRVALDANEQVTFTTESGAEYDVARKSWGFYATPSLNGRLQKFGLRGVLVKNRINQYFVMLVEQDRESLFDEYLSDEGLVVVCRLNDTRELESLEKSIEQPK